MSVRYISVCSGIEAASTAWMPIGWKPVAFSEIEPFPCNVLAHHHPDVPNWGDMTKYKEWPDASIDLLCGGTPCQSFSVAGLRKGLADPRGNLMLTFGAIAAKYRPRWLVWENVPGILSSNKGRDFGSFLGLLAELGYGFAYRVLDAQYVRVESHPRAVPQRRRRVFVVGHSGGLWQRAAAVLFERESLCGHPAPSREAGQAIARPFRAGAPNGGPGHGARSGDSNDELIVPVAFGGNNQSGPIDVATARNACASASGRMDFESETFLVEATHTLRGEGFDASEDDTGRGTPLVPVHCREVAQTITSNYGRQVDNTDTALGPNILAFDTTQITSKANRSSPKPGDPCHPLAAGAHAPVIAFPERLSGTQCASAEEVSPSLGALNPTAVAFQERGRADGRSLEIGREVAYALTAPNAGGHTHERNVLTPTMEVRRLTPLECMRLQGFPDGHTAITVKGKPAADGPQYKAIGNSWAINCARWIGERIDSVERIVNEVPA